MTNRIQSPRLNASRNTAAKTATKTVRLIYFNKCVDGQTDRYVFSYEPHRVAELLHKLAQYASNPELSFEWCDAGRIAHEVSKRARASA